eukprot:jgi/Orpsp1_1/1179089/evm.model.c7180000067880.1
MEYLPDEENENKVSDSKVINLTFVLIALAIVAIGALIISTYYYKDKNSSYFLIPIATILISIFYIIAIKKEITIFMYVHLTMLFIYLFSAIFLGIGFFIASIVFQFLRKDYEDVFSFWIIFVDLMILLVAFVYFINYNIKYGIKYKNQIKMGPIEKDRALEANIDQANIVQTNKIDN